MIQYYYCILCTHTEARARFNQENEQSPTHRMEMKMCLWMWKWKMGNEEGGGEGVGVLIKVHEALVPIWARYCASGIISRFNLADNFELSNWLDGTQFDVDVYITFITIENRKNHTGGASDTMAIKKYFHKIHLRTLLT